MADLEIVFTSDGSHTLYRKDLNEHYHSTHGSVQESNHVFIKKGLDYFLKKNSSKNTITILEVGLGTALNAMLTLRYLSEHSCNCQVHYLALEPNPIPLEVVGELNYAAQLGFTQAEQAAFEAMHRCGSDEKIQLATNFIFQKTTKTLQGYSITDSIDIIYYDAFGPRAQAEMWEQPLFAKIYNGINPDGILVTYCAKGEVKRSLKAAGFVVETLPGPPGKREMTRAIRIRY